MCEVGIVIQFGTELFQPRIYRPGTIVDRVTNMLVSGAGLRGACSPHVCHLGIRSGDDLASTHPHAHTLVDVLSSPTQHLVVVSSAFIPPLPGHAR